MEKGLPWKSAPNGVTAGIYNCRGDLVADAESAELAEFIVKMVNTAPDYIVRTMVSGLTAHLARAQAAVIVLDRWARENNPNPW